jgi:hypothetical protein
MPNNSETSFSCKEPGCDQKVDYEPKPIPGMELKKDSSSNKSKVVYLECSKGHIHPYTVTS